MGDLWWLNGPSEGIGLFEGFWDVHYLGVLYSLLDMRVYKYNSDYM